MQANGIVLGIVGSPNPEGRTNQLVRSALKGAAGAGAQTELIQMSEHLVGACKDCLPWVCQNNGRCTFEDPEFDFFCEKIGNCGGLVLGAPVYWWDASAMVKHFIQKMFRIHARPGTFQGVPALGLAIAGGTGNGLVTGYRSVYHYFQVMQMRALEPVPATRFNFDQALVRAGELGAQLAGMADKRHPFQDLEERLAWYDNLPFLGLGRAGERRLLADLTAMASPEELGAAVLSGLARSDALAAAGKIIESMKETTRVYDAGVKAFEHK